MLFRTAAFILLSILSSFALADKNRYELTYEVTITNITRGQTFTPQLVATHSRQVSLFEVGDLASEPLAILAEGGNTQPLSDWLISQGKDVGEVKTIPGLLGPGESVSTIITANPYRRSFISMAAMLIPTNDTFVAVNGIKLPLRGKKTRLLSAYDAGTEFNDQNCANIPGPRCGGEGVSEPSDSDEGYIYIGNGFHDLGTVDEEGNEILKPSVYDWRNSVAKITVQRVY